MSRKDFVWVLSLVCVAVVLVAWIVFHFSAIAYFIGKFFRVLTPFYIGFGIAYVLNRSVNWFVTTLKWHRGLAIALLYVFILTVISLFMAYAIPQMINSSVQITQEIKRGVIQLSAWANDSAETFGPLQQVIYEQFNQMAEWMTLLSNYLITNMATLFKNIASAFFNVFFGVIISVYMLISKHKQVTLFKRLVTVLLPKKNADEFLKFAAQVNQIFSHFMSGLIVEALIVGVLAYMALSLMGVKYPMILAAIITMTNVVPYIGPFLGAIPAVLSTLMYDPILALWVALMILVLQQLDGNFIGPKVMGNYIGMDPVWIILSITIGGGLAGVLGVLLAIPTGAIIKIVIERLLINYQIKHPHID